VAIRPFVRFDYSGHHVKSSSRAAYYMVASAFGFAAMAMLVKVAARRGIPTGEVVLVRAVVTLIASFVMVRRAGLSLWGTQRGKLVMRGIYGFGGLSFYYLSLAHLPLADATVIQNATPLIVSVLAWLVLGESVGWPTAGAIACGIAGVVMIVRPTGESLDMFGVATGLGSLMCSSVAYVTVRQLSRTEHPLVIVWYFPLIATPLCIPWAIATWRTPQPIEWLLLITIGLCTQIGQVFLTLALSIERAGRTMTYGYVQVAFAMVWGYLVFAQVPTIYTFGGAALIIGGTVLLAAVGSAPPTPK
jgi:drug/metabolite transporter (DMT)-like permease